MKRLLVLDALRGFFIIFVILFHALGHVMLWNGALIERQEIQTWTMVLFSPLILLGTWAPVFALISGAATAYVLHYLMAQGRGHALGAHVRGVYYNSAFLYVCSLIHMSMLHFRVVFNGAERFSFVTGSLEQGRLAKADVDLLFFTDAVALVAMAGVIVASVLWLLWRGDGFAHARRNYAVLVTLGLLWFLAAPWLHKALDTSFFAAVTDRDVPTALALKLIIGPPHSTFPNAGFSLFGAVLGIALARHEALAHLRRFGYGFGVFCVAVGGLILLYAGVPIGPERVGTALPVQLHFLNLGLMLMVLTYFIGRFEYQDAARRAAIAQRTTGVRRFGLMGMTAYICESVLCVINLTWYLPLFAGAPLPARYLGLFLFGGMQIALWHGLLRLWEKVEFKYSFEWWAVHVVGRLRGRYSHRLQVSEVLYHPVAVPEQGSA